MLCFKYFVLLTIVKKVSENRAWKTNRNLLIEGGWESVDIMENVRELTCFIFACLHYIPVIHL